MRNIILIIILYFPISLFAQQYSETINFDATGDQEIALGRYQVGTAIRIECQISGGWAEDGGIYHLAADWNKVPKVIYRAESSISNRLTFYAYLANTNNVYLFATWDNQSPSEGHSNNIKLTISSEGAIDVNNKGDFSQSTELENVLVVQSNTGNVGIGTTSPDSKLAVDGHIHTKEVKVSLDGWSDFVFYDDYTLPTLEEVEKHIEEKGHLPEIPSEKEVIENGVYLGKMDAKLLRKIEELTLYLIEQNKEIKALKEKIELLENK